MTNEEEQITLNIDLYDNIMTEKEATTPAALVSPALCTTNR